MKLKTYRREDQTSRRRMNQVKLNARLDRRNKKKTYLLLPCQVYVSEFPSPERFSNVEITQRPPSLTNVATLRLLLLRSIHLFLCREVQCQLCEHRSSWQRHQLLENELHIFTNIDKHQKCTYVECTFIPHSPTVHVTKYESRREQEGAMPQT